jgi:hypothetical protein
VIPAFCVNTFAAKQAECINLKGAFMPAKIKIDGDYAVENSSYLIRLDAFDELGQEVIPKTGTWSLTDADGATINSRSQIVISPLAATMYILLTDKDLALSVGFTGTSEKRFFLFEGTYDSTHGADNPLKDQLIFPVVNLAKIKAT